MKKILLAVSTAVLLCVSQFTHAEITADNLPDMGNLALLIGDANDEFDEESVLDEEGRISSGMPVDDSSRGATAAEIASILAQGNAENQQQVEEWLEKLRTAFEDRLTQANFEVKDVGVGLAVSFITFWELAEDRILSEEAEFKLGKYLVHTFKGMADSPEFQNVSADEKARLYDWTMTTPLAFYSMIDGLDKEGKTQEVQQLREKSASLFVEVFKVPHDFFTLSEDGEMGADIDTISSYQEQNGLAESSGFEAQSSGEKQDGVSEKNLEEETGLSDDW